MSDIDVTIQVTPELELGNLKSDLESALSGIESGLGRMKIQVDASQASSKIQELKTELEGLSRVASVAVGSPFEMSLINGFAGVRREIKSISEQLVNLGTSSGNNLSEQFSGVTQTVDSVKESISSLKDVMASFNGVTLNLGLGSSGFSNNAAYGMSARENIKQLKEQAAELEKFFDYFYGGNGIGKLMSSNGVTGDGRDRLSAFSRFLMDDFSNAISSNKLGEQLNAYKEYINFIQEAANIKGIDISPVTEQFTSSADSLVSATQKIASGEAAAEAGMQKFKELIGSSIDATELSERLTSINTSIDNIYSSIGNLKLDNSSFESFISSITNAVTAIDSLTAALDNLSTVKNEVMSSGDDSGSLDSESKIIKLSEDANAYNDALRKVNNTLTTAYANQKKWTTAESGASSGDFQRYSDEINRLETLKSELGDKTKAEFSSTFKDISAGLSEAVNQMEAAGERVKLPDTLKSDTKEYSDAITKANNQIATMQRNLDSWGKIDGFSDANQANLKTYSDSLNDIIALRDKLKAQEEPITETSFAKQLSDAKSSASEVIPALEHAARVAKDLQSAQSFTPFREGMSGYSKMVSNIDEQISSIETKIAETRTRSTQLFGEGGNKELDAEITKLEQFLTEYNSLQEKLADGTKQGGISKVGAGDEYAKITKGAKEAATAIDDYIRAANGSRPLNEDAFGAKQLKDAKDTLAIMQNNLKKWGAAENGNSKDAYNVYKQQSEALEQLIQDAEKGSVAVDDFKQRLSDIKKVGKESADTIKANGEDMTSFSTKLSGMIQRFSFYFSMTRVVMMTIQKLKEMVKASMEIETAMARIQIVTGATDTQMTSFFESASKQAQELGKNITDVAKSIETFSRLGYSLTDATQLSKYANIMSNVGDTTVENATTGITSIIKGYGLNPSDAEHVSDVLINVGQKYAISAEELMEAFQRGGAALAASGTSFEESAALFAATNASLQNAATTGTLWKTVSARIRSAKTELEELGEDTTDLADGFSKYREELKALTGVDIMEDEDHYKSMLTIFNELASVWDDLRSDEARARGAEILGGTRNLSGIMSTIQNIKDAQNAYNDAMDSAGVSMEANNIYMETTEAHVGQLKASFQELSVDVFNSDFMKGFVDGARGAVEVLDTIIDKIGVLSTVAVGALGGMALAKNIDVLKTAFTGLMGAISGPQIAIAIGAIATIGFVIKAISDYNKSVSYEGKLEKATESAQKFKESTDELKSIDAEIESVRAKIEEINSIGGVSLTKEGELDNLQNTLDNLEIEKALLEEINALNKEQALSDARDFFDSKSWYDTGRTETKTKGNGYDYEEAITRQGTPFERALDYQKSINEATEQRKRLLKDIEDAKNGENDLDKTTLKNYQARADKLKEQLTFLTGEQKKTLEDIRTNYATFFDANGNVYKGYESAVDEVRNFYKELKGIGSAYTEQTQLESFTTAVSNRLSSNASRAVDSYKKIKDEFDKLGIDEGKTSFGNIDLNDRQTLKWTTSNIEKYKDALDSWGMSAEKVKDTISTVIGGSDNFGNEEHPLEIAFSPMLQTDTGAILLDKDTVYSYIRGIISEANNRAKEQGKDGWTTEDLFKIDQEGIKGFEAEGVKITGLIADVGESAIKTGEAMHYLGKDGAIAMEKLSADSAKALSTMSADKFANIFKLDKMKSGFGDKNLLDFSDSIAGSSEMSSVINSIVQEALELGLISDTSESSVRGLAESLAEAGAIGQESAESLSDFAEAAEESVDAMEALNKYNDAYTSAMSASTSATGLNTQQIKDLTDAYNHLDGFNPSILFEKTANGIHLNEEYLKKLNAQIENEKMTELWQNLEKLEEQRAQMDANHEDTSKIDAEIESARQLIAQYEGLTSAYNKWQSAKSATKERDMYQNVGSAYEQMKETLDQGWYGDEELNAYLDMMLSASKRTGDAYEDFQELDRKIKGTSHSLMDYWQYDDDKNLVTDGMYDFLDDVNKVFGDTYAKVDEDGKYTWDLTNGKLEEVAEHFGTTTEMIQMFERALIDAGATVILDSQEIDDLQGNLQKLQQAGQISSDIDLGFEASEMSLEDIQSKIKELENEKVRIEAEADTGEADTALNQLDATIAALKNQEIAVKIQTELASGKSIDDLLGDEDLATTLDIDTSQVEEARAMLEQLKSGVDVPVTIRMDESQFEQLVSGERQETVTVTYTKDTSDPDGYQPEPKDGKVTFKKDSSDPDNYQPPPKDGLVTFHKNTSEIDNYQPLDKHATVTYHVVVDGAIPAGGGTYAGTMSSVSVARANGTAYNAPWNFRNAYANGQVALSKDEIALVNELGTESIILICDFIQQCISNIYLIAGSSL